MTHGDPALQVAALLIAELGHGIAAAKLGGLEYRNGAPAGAQYGSAQRLAALWRTLAVPGDLGAALDGFGQPVLLVDDRIGTGWIMTVGAKPRCECAAPAMLPFALAVNT